MPSTPSPTNFRYCRTSCSCFVYQAIQLSERIPDRSAFCCYYLFAPFVVFVKTHDFSFSLIHNFVVNLPPLGLLGSNHTTNLYYMQISVIALSAKRPLEIDKKAFSYGLIYVESGRLGRKFNKKKDVFLIFLLFCCFIPWNSIHLSRKL